MEQRNAGSTQIEYLLALRVQWCGKLHLSKIEERSQRWKRKIGTELMGEGGRGLRGYDKELQMNIAKKTKCLTCVIPSQTRNATRSLIDFSSISLPISAEAVLPHWIHHLYAL
jgi:hypothetical protein